MGEEFNKLFDEVTNIKCSYQVAIVNIKNRIQSLTDDIAYITEEDGGSKEMIEKRKQQITTLKWALLQFGEKFDE